MTTRSLTRALGATASIAAVGILIGAASAPGDTAHAAAAKKITARGVGAVKLGRTFHRLRAAHLVGKLRQGCELAGPQERFAKLRAPLKGTVDFTHSTPRKVRDVVISGKGAKARGVGVGDGLSDIIAAFPKAKVDHSGESTFLLTFVRVPKSGGGKLEFAVSTTTHKITLIGVPLIPTCD
jgi:hypothetical protein